MFTKIYFQIDENGKPLKIGSERILTAKNCNCKQFEIYHGAMRGCEVIKVYRSQIINVEKDTYNEDGWPPTCLFIMHAPKVRLMGHTVSIVGFEEHNLSLAGLLHEGWKVKKHPIKDMMDARYEQYNISNDIDRSVPYSIFPQAIVVS